jgi:hypothetical protein
MNKKEMVLNSHGVRIKKCCASCQHKNIGKSENQRICMLGEGEVKKTYLCADWEMSDTCKEYKMNAQGRIKKPHYIEWMKQRVSEINKRDITEEEAVKILEERNQPVKVKTNIAERAKQALISELPKRYEKNVGERYV